AFDVVTLPPLRARRDDIALLAEHFATRMTAELKRPYFAGFTPTAISVLMAHHWPGNVRELRNVVERSVCRATQPDQPLPDIVLDAFMPGDRKADWYVRDGAAVREINGIPAGRSNSEEANLRPTGIGPGRSETEAPTPSVNAAAPPPDYRTAVRAFETQLLQRALHDARFNQRRAAEALGLSYDQLRHLLKTHKAAMPEGT
ncbi:MAG: helix-turn-helix domain-containing protein, partial [Acetobacteraceae bacterium]